MTIDVAVGITAASSNKASPYRPLRWDSQQWLSVKSSDMRFSQILLEPQGSEDGDAKVMPGSKVKNCSVSSCEKRAVQGGVCLSHGAKRTRKRCKVIGCDKIVISSGVCVSHGARVKRCRVEKCEKKAVQGGVCVGHGAKVKRCTAGSCTKKAVQGGVCIAHGAKVRRSGARSEPSSPASSPENRNFLSIDQEWERESPLYARVGSPLGLGSIISRLAASATLRDEERGSPHSGPSSPLSLNATTEKQSPRNLHFNPARSAGAPAHLLGASPFADTRSLAGSTLHGIGVPEVRSPSVLYSTANLGLPSAGSLPSTANFNSLQLHTSTSRASAQSLNALSSGLPTSFAFPIPGRLTTPETRSLEASQRSSSELPMSLPRFSTSSRSLTSAASPRSMQHPDLGLKSAMQGPYKSHKVSSPPSGLMVRPCSQTGCSAYAQNGDYCAAHS